MLIIGARHQLAPLKALEQFGADLGMKLAWTFSIEQVKGRRPYVFIDVGTHACERFAGSEVCATRRSVPAALIAKFLPAALSSGAKVVILDVAPYSDGVERATLQRALDAVPHGAVIVPLDVRPAGSGSEMRVADKQRLTSPNVHLAVFATEIDQRGWDGVVRGFPTQMRIIDGGIAKAVPTAPYLAATLVRSDAAIRCRQDGTFCSNGALPRQPSSNATSPVVFSFPSLAFTDPAIYAGRPEAGAYQSAQIRLADRGITRMDAALLLKDARGDFTPRKEFKDGVVVLGSSSAAALDTHMTPLGPMTGAELILNATRAFVELRAAPPNAPPPSFMEELEGKASGALLPAAIMTAAWLAIFGIAVRIGDRTFPRRLARAGTSFVIFTAAMLLSVFVELYGAASTLANSLASGSSVDILTPILALGLEGYAEAIKTLTTAVENLILGAIATVTARTRSVIFTSLSRGRTRRGGKDG